MVPENMVKEQGGGSGKGTKPIEAHYCSGDHVGSQGLDPPGIFKQLHGTCLKVSAEGQGAGVFPSSLPSLLRIAARADTLQHFPLPTGGLSTTREHP